MTNKKVLASLMLEGLKTVGVKFQGSENIYTYKTMLDLGMFDMCVVMTPSDKFKIVEVVEVHDYPMLEVESDLDYKWIIDVVSVDKYNHYIMVEEKLEEELRKLEHKAIKENAAKMLSETLGVTVEDLESSIKAIDICTDSKE